MVPRPKLWISQEGLVATEITPMLLPTIMRAMSVNSPHFFFFTVRGLSAKMKQYNWMTVRNYTLSLIFVLAGRGYRRHLQYSMFYHITGHSQPEINHPQTSDRCLQNFECYGNISANSNNHVETFLNSIVWCTTGIRWNNICGSVAIVWFSHLEIKRCFSPKSSH